MSGVGFAGFRLSRVWTVEKRCTLEHVLTEAGGAFRDSPEYTSSRWKTGIEFAGAEFVSGLVQVSGVGSISGFTMNGATVFFAHLGLKLAKFYVLLSNPPRKTCPG